MGGPPRVVPDGAAVRYCCGARSCSPAVSSECGAPVAECLPSFSSECELGHPAGAAALAKAEGKWPPSERLEHDVTPAAAKSAVVGLVAVSDFGCCAWLQGPVACHI